MECFCNDLQIESHMTDDNLFMDFQERAMIRIPCSFQLLFKDLQKWMIAIKVKLHLCMNLTSIISKALLNISSDDNFMLPASTNKD